MKEDVIKLLQVSLAVVLVVSIIYYSSSQLNNNFAECDKDLGVVVEKHFQQAYSGGFGGVTSDWKFVYILDSGGSLSTQDVYEVSEKVYRKSYCSK